MWAEEGALIRNVFTANACLPWAKLVMGSPPEQPSHGSSRPCHFRASRTLTLANSSCRRDAAARVRVRRTARGSETNAPEPCNICFDLSEKSGSISIVLDS